MTLKNKMGTYNNYLIVDSPKFLADVTPNCATWKYISLSDLRGDHLEGHSIDVLGNKAFIFGGGKPYSAIHH